MVLGFLSVGGGNSLPSVRRSSLLSCTRGSGRNTSTPRGTLGRETTDDKPDRLAVVGYKEH